MGVRGWVGGVLLGTHVDKEQVSAGGTVTPETLGGGAALPKFKKRGTTSFGAGGRSQQEQVGAFWG